MIVQLQEVETKGIYKIITAARPAYAGTEGCYVLRMFFLLFFFI